MATRMAAVPTLATLAMATLTAAGACGGDAEDDAPADEAPPSVEADRPATDAGADMDVSLTTESGRLSGLYVHLADAPAFTPCGTAALVTDIGGAAADSLDRAYLLERGTPGDAVLASIVGRLAPGATPSGVRLVVDSVGGVEAGEACPGQGAAPPLEGTAWQLVGLPERDEGLGAAGAWMRLEEDGTLAGFTGCRELTGRYTWTGTRLAFTSLDRQVAMCDQAEVHERFLAALAGTGSYRYRDRGLDLLDEDGTVARLEEG